MKKSILYTILAVFVIMLSLSSVSAADDLNDNSTVITDVATPNTGATHIINSGSDSSTIQKTIDDASAGDTIFFQNGEYKDISLTVDKKNLTFTSDGDVTLIGLAIKNPTIMQFTATASNANIKNINFVSSAYQGSTWNGYAVSITGAQNITVDNCKFINGSAGVNIAGSAHNITVNQCYFMGNANMSTVNVGVKEQGGKAIGIMGGSLYTLTNNIFNGTLLDGVSIASGAKEVYIDNNTFKDNCYGIFYGGGISNIFLTNNEFDNCLVYGIGLVKAASDSLIKDNTFKLNNGANAIYLEQGNTAHASPTVISNVTITGNEFSTVKTGDKAVAIEGCGLNALNCTGPLEITENSVSNGVSLFEYKQNETVTPQNDPLLIFDKNVYHVDNTLSNAEIQTLINNAEKNSVIFFDKGDYKDVSLSINKKGLTLTSDGDANLYGISTKNPTVLTLNPTASNTEVSNINFIMATYQGSTFSGYGIDIQSAQNITVDNCNFINGSSGVNINGAHNITVNECYFTGNANMSTVNVGVKEKGDKAIGIKSGNLYILTNNIFDGKVLDGISIAGGAKDVYIDNNTFKDNCYGIFYGGGISNLTMTNNEFDNCLVYSIGLVKSASDSLIANNTFVLVDESTGIYLEQGNDAHGYPTTISNITITENTFKTNETTPSDIKAVYVYSVSGPLAVSGPVDINKNTVDKGIQMFSFFESDWGSSDNIHIEPTVPEYTLEGNDLVMYEKNGSSFNVKVTDKDGNPVEGAKVIFNIEGGDYERTTDKNGIASLAMNLRAGNYTITSTLKTESTDDITINNKITILATIEGKDLVKYYKNGSQYQVKILDGQGKPIANKVVTMNIDGVFYQRTTDENGIATLNINLRPGTYIITVYHPDHNTTMSSNTITVLSTIEANDLVKEFQNASQYHVKILDDQGKPIANQKVTMNIDGVFYTRTTDANGEAILNINLRPGEFIITVEHPVNHQMFSNKITVLETKQDNFL